MTLAHTAIVFAFEPSADGTRRVEGEVGPLDGGDLLGLALLTAESWAKSGRASLLDCAKDLRAALAGRGRGDDVRQTLHDLAAVWEGKGSLDEAMRLRFLAAQVLTLRAAPTHVRIAEAS